MSEHGFRFSRRRALLSLPYLLAGISAVGTEVYAQRAGAEVHEINAETTERIRSISASLLEQGKVIVGQFKVLQRQDMHETSLVRPVLHADVIADSLLMMAYMEGGDQGLERASNFLSRHGLDVREAGLDTDVAGETTFVGSESSDSVNITLSSETFINPQTKDSAINIIGHELYHVEQNVRDGDAVFAEKIIKLAGAAITGSLLAAPAGIGVMATAVKVSDAMDRYQLPRRPAIRLAAKFAAGTAIVGAGYMAVNPIVSGAMYVYQTELSPYEAQAYAQGGDSLQLGELASIEPLRSSLQQIVTYEPVS